MRKKYMLFWLNIVRNWHFCPA